MTIFRIKKELDGAFWNLKPGCVYHVETAAANKLINAGDAEPVIETAMAPAPGANKRARKDKGTDRVPSDTGGDKAPPTSDD